MSINKKQPTNRVLKRELRDCLGRDDFIHEVNGFAEKYRERRLINPLLPFLYDREPLIKWRAVTAIGIVTARLAKTNIESARVIMRRLMWNLNDESGGIGWGSPESMGEIMAREKRLAREYSAILTSYVTPGKNHLEHEGLQSGGLWGIGRLGRTYTGMLDNAADYLFPYMESTDVAIRGHAVWAAMSLENEKISTRLRQLQTDRGRFTLYQNNRLEDIDIGNMIITAGQSMATS